MDLAPHALSVVFTRAEAAACGTGPTTSREERPAVLAESMGDRSRARVILTSGREALWSRTQHPRAG